MRAAHGQCILRLVDPVCSPVLLRDTCLCFLQIVTGLERFLRLVDPSASSSQVPTAVASSKASHRDSDEGPLFQQCCAWPGQSQVEGAVQRGGAAADGLHGPEGD